MDLIRVLGQNVGLLPRFNVFEVRMAATKDEPRKKKERKSTKIRPERDYKEKKELEQQTALIWSSFSLKRESLERIMF